MFVCLLSVRTVGSLIENRLEVINQSDTLTKGVSQICVDGLYIILILVANCG